MTASTQDEFPPPPKEGSLAYGAYLKIPELLSLQETRSDPEEHDELLFIVIHQVYELWFKLILHELDRAVVTMQEGDLYATLPTLRRVRTVLKTLVGQVDILGTLTPLDFASFRDRLDQASGFQSAQFREFEYLLGAKRPALLKFHKEGSDAYKRMQRRLKEPSLRNAFHTFLAKNGVELPEAILNEDVTQATEPSPQMQDILEKLYREDTQSRMLMEVLTDIDEGVQEWRYRHVKMVERTIGKKIGTGGSAGAEYLRTTLFRPVFPDLWEIRSRF